MRVALGRCTRAALLSWLRVGCICWRRYAKVEWSASDCQIAVQLELHVSVELKSDVTQRAPQRALCHVGGDPCPIVRFTKAAV